MKSVFLVMAICVLSPAIAEDIIDAGKIEVYDKQDVVESALQPVFPETIKLANTLKDFKYYQSLKSSLISTELFEFKELPVTENVTSNDQLETNTVLKYTKAAISIFYRIFVAVMCLIVAIKTYKVLHSYATENEDTASRKFWEVVLELVAAVSFFALLTPSFDGLPVYFVVLLVSILVALEVANMIMLSTFSHAQLHVIEPSDLRVENALDISVSKFKNEVIEGAKGRLLEDALLNTSMLLQQYKYKKGVPIASNEALDDVGDRQIKLEALLNSEEFSQKNCLASDNWYQGSATSYGCAWLHQDGTDLGIINSKLQLKYAVAFDPEKLPSNQQAAGQKIAQGFEDAVKAYTEFQKAIICPSVLGRKVTTDELEMNIFCAKRDSTGSVIKGQFYGYDVIDEHWQKASPETLDLKFDWDAHTAVAVDLFNSRYKEEYSKRVEPVKIYDSGIVTLPYQFVSALSKYESQKTELSKTSSRLASRTISTLTDDVGGSYTSKPESLRGIDTNEETVRYLEKHFPFAVDAWYMNTVDKDVIKPITEEENGSTFAAFIDYREMAISRAMLLYGLGVSFDVFGLPFSKEIEFWATISIYVAKFVHFSVIIALSWFPLMLVWIYGFRKCNTNNH